MEGPWDFICKAGSRLYILVRRYTLPVYVLVVFQLTDYVLAKMVFVPQQYCTLLHSFLFPLRAERETICANYIS